MKKILVIISAMFIISGCGESFDAAYDSFRSPLNTAPSVSIDSIAGWQTSPASLTGNASDSDNDALTYRWSEVTSYGVIFTQPENSETSVIFTGNINGDVAVTAVIRFSASDGEDESHRDINLQIYRNDVLFIAPAGAGSGNHPESPLKGGIPGELADAITYANNSSKRIVALASGTYSISSAINLIENVSIYGGYSSSDWSRNAEAYESIIRDTTVYPTSGIPNSAIKASAGITNATLINGIVVETGRGSWATGIQCLSASGLKIENCIIRSRTDGSDKNFDQQFGIHLNNSDNIVIQNCKITLGDTEKGAGASIWTVGIGIVGTVRAVINGNLIINGRAILNGTSTTNAYGINAFAPSNASLTIINNLISSGISQYGPSYGIRIYADPAGTYKIQNNSILALNPGTSNTSGACIRLGTTSGTTENVENNILIAFGFPDTDCIVTAADCLPESVKNNLFYLDTANNNNSFYDNSTLPTTKNLTTPVTTLGNLTLLDLGNITENIYNYFADFDGADNDVTSLSDNDWHIVKDINTPMNLLYGGLDLSSSILFDFDGNSRTNLNALKATNAGAGGFTLGAFEED